MAILISSVNNALGGKAKPEDYLLSKTPKKKQEDGKMNIGKYQPIDEADLEAFLKPMV